MKRADKRSTFDHGILLGLLAGAAAAWSTTAACDGNGGSTPDVIDDGGGEADELSEVPDVPEATDTPDVTDELDVPDGEGGVCVDVDLDGHGENCAAGSDCDDADPLHFEDCATCATAHQPGCLCAPWDTPACYEGPPGTAGVGQCVAGTRPCVGTHLSYECTGQTLPAPAEICGDSIDNDCNGLGDEEAAGPCHDCDSTCNTSGTVVPDPEDPGSTGIGGNPAGPGIVLGVEDIHAAFVWVPNTEEGSVSKLEIATGTELGRYRVGQTGTNNDAPSRTAVDGFGDMYVAGQADVSSVMNQGSVTKIAGDVSHCVDRNVSGTIDTSVGATRLPLGTDECVLWRVPVGDPGAVPRALAVHVAAAGTAGSPWVGTWNEQRFYRLDPRNGSVADTVDVEVKPFGAVAAPGDWIWISGREPAPAGIQRFSAATGGLDPVVVAPSECDAYGIAVDAEGRVYLGGTGSTVCRYDPADGSWLTITLPRPNATGVAVSPTDVVWAVSHDATAVSLSQFPASDPTAIVSTDVPGDAAWAVAADGFGYVWTVNHDSATVTRFNAGTSETAQFDVGRGPVAYSDFVGVERTIVATSGGWYANFERCDVADEDRWGEVRWAISTPADSSVTLSASSAATAADLETAVPVVLATIPPATATSADLEAALAAAAIPSNAHLRITAALTAGTGGESPVVSGIEVRWHCAE
ncbi:MAG: hypothetical protein HY905_14120 [Deltaproteobacteria bacterium]|nr:hypothetical protein [Deltaproteobacteria bacterium]